MFKSDSDLNQAFPSNKRITL